MVKIFSSFFIGIVEELDGVLIFKTLLSVLLYMVATLVYGGCKYLYLKVQHSTAFVKKQAIC